MTVDCIKKRRLAICAQEPRARVRSFVRFVRASLAGWLVGWLVKATMMNLLKWWTCAQQKAFWIRVDYTRRMCSTKSRWENMKRGNTKRRKEHGKLHKNHPEKCTAIVQYSVDTHTAHRTHTHSRPNKKEKESMRNRKWNFVLTHDSTGMWFIVSNPKILSPFKCIWNICGRALNRILCNIFYELFRNSKNPTYFKRA